MRTTRLVLAAAAVAAVAGLSQPAAADPQCKLYLDYDNPIAETTGLPVYAEVPRPMYVC